MIKLYKVKYTISPKSPSGRAMRYSRSTAIMRMLLNELEITLTHMSKGGLSYEVLLMVREGVPVEPFLLKHLPPISTSTTIKIDSIEILGKFAPNNQNFSVGEDRYDKIRR